MKKRFVWMLAAILVSGNMLAQQVKYTVSGTYTVDGAKVYLKDRLTEETKANLGDLNKK